jgi:hypothetical protein
VVLDLNRPFREEDVFSKKTRDLIEILKNPFRTQQENHLDELHELGINLDEIGTTATYLGMDMLRWAFAKHDRDRPPALTAYCSLVENFPPSRPLRFDVYTAPRPQAGLTNLLSGVSKSLQLYHEMTGDSGLTVVPEIILEVLSSGFETGKDEPLEVKALLDYAPGRRLLATVADCKDGRDVRTAFIDELRGPRTIRRFAYGLMDAGVFDKHARQVAAFALSNQNKYFPKKNLVTVELRELHRLEHLADHAVAIGRPNLHASAKRSIEAQQDYIEGLRTPLY